MTRTMESIKKSVRKSKPDGKRMTLYLSESTYKAFKRLCSPVSVSRVVNGLMLREIVRARRE